MNSVVMGGQWGDEGKGKIVDLLSKNSNVVARYQGGANAGHTVYKEGKKIVLHQIPSGILQKNCLCDLGNGMVIDPVELAKEIKELNSLNMPTSNIYISPNAHIVTPLHKGIDLKNEAQSEKIKPEKPEAKKEDTARDKTDADSEPESTTESEEINKTKN